MTSLAEYSFEFVPRVSVSRVYDDNIYLDSINEESDNITTVSPGIAMTISSLHRTLSVDYAPAWVWYDKYDQHNTVRHSGTLSYAQDLSQQLRFDLTDTYLKSEQPLEETEEVEGIRRTRDTYQRNTASASLRYQFGPESALTLGYRHSLLENEDPSIDDGTIQTPFCSMTHWFNTKNALELDYTLTKADFYRDDDTETGDDYTGHGTDIRYMHRFTPRTTGSIRYGLTTRNFEGDTEDYNVHESALGLEYSLSPDLSLLLEGGFFVQDNETSADESGLIFNAALIGVKRFHFDRGTFTMGSRAGWDEAYLEGERRGFTTYWSADSTLEYWFMERLSGYASGLFRLDRNAENEEWKTWRANCGLRLEFLRWFSLSLDYSHAERDDDIDTADYAVNRVMLIVSAGKPYEW
jgi:hypothetical protein